ncbi:cell division protein ZapA [uncultured Sphingomonas sp.]|uniref:cell division protein ZapA n=1 Tax=uncultured Sphingomonas sp. TaxID=158754 RepID=UPI0025F4062B|nr:cell division protein ZapA [uncultured Sphingomonas sp.]
MAQVTLKVGGRRYELACRDGEEPHLELLGTMVDAKAHQAARALGNANEPRQLLLAALLLADELSELRAGAPDPERDSTARALQTLAQRIEALAERLENGGVAS